MKENHRTLLGALKDAGVANPFFVRRGNRDLLCASVGKFKVSLAAVRHVRHGWRVMLLRWASTGSALPEGATVWRNGAGRSASFLAPTDRAAASLVKGHYKAVVQAWEAGGCIPGGRKALIP